MSLREEQCNKVCRILDDVLANRPTERDSLILAVRKAFAEPQERTGYWIYDGFDHPHGIEWCHCSRCGNQENVKSVYTQIDKYPYCAKCGARMGVDNEHDSNSDHSILAR